MQLPQYFAERRALLVGLDTDLFEGCDFGTLTPIPEIRKDIRDLVQRDLDGFDAVVHWQLCRIILWVTLGSAIDV